MKRALLAILIVLSSGSCKDMPEKSNKSETPPKQEIKTVEKIPSGIKKIVQFANLKTEEASDINDLLNFKAVGTEGSVTEIEMNEAEKLFSGLMKTKPVNKYPVYEISNSDRVILTVQGKGFGGPIWATILVDKKGRLIEKIAFQHIF